ncbi:MAG: c-type cytochrome domain-containing protein [Solitalea sp.]
MKFLKNATINLLLGLNVFILFFLLFEGRIVLPAALQVVGRMHPLLLHFPIVVLVLALLFELCSRHIAPRDAPQADTAAAPPHAPAVVEPLLYAGALSAALTVVAGLLLSKEEGYSGSTLLWHKWTGVAISFASALLLWYYRAKPLRGRLFRPALAATCLVLVVAGHLGAALTHGENFVLQPILPAKEKKVDLATAVVFSDLVLPVFEEKCSSCHNPDKAKGQLVLTDSAAILAGGENGPLLVPGDPASSLLMERLLLEIDHKHHMPPKNRPQLTPQEIALVEAWLRAGADFRLPLAALPPNDTIHRLAEALYDTAPRAETFDFPPADPDQVQQLANAYRVIAPLAEGSPALDVSFFNAASFSGQALAALEPIAQQVVHLNLSGMPLEDADFEQISRFENLRQLNLNYTPASDRHLDRIARLPHLRSLMLSGTQVSPQGLDSLAAHPPLRHLYVWNTPVTHQHARLWTQRRPQLQVETGFYDDGTLILPLNSPEMHPDKAFFRQPFQLTLSHPISETSIHYTLDGTEPDSIHAPRFEKPLQISENTLVKVRAFKQGWTGSQTLQTYFYKASYKPDSVRLETQPDPQYKARQAVSLFDLENGSTDIRDGKWLGYQGMPLEAYLLFNQPIQINEVAVSSLVNTGGHIFPPASIEVWGGDDPEDLKLLGTANPDKLQEHQPVEKQIYRNTLNGNTVSYLKVIVRPLDKLPSWHGAQGQPAWVFVDEILLN